MTDYANSREAINTIKLLSFWKTPERFFQVSIQFNSLLGSDKAKDKLF